ncbi:MAG TPA: hypothetical protein VMV10_30865 [Pirellulales bacterium]|nr:hypothetical protein [Pirellulales bacterium]
MGRFILIDHSLVDYAGHHYEYARAVLDAAAESGYESVLATNRRFRSELREAWPIIPAYKYGVWLHQGASEWQIGLWRALHAVRRRVRPTSPSGRSVDKHADASNRKFGLLRRQFDAARQRRFIRDTASLLERLAVAADDVIFVPTLSHVDFAALQGLWRTDRESRRPVWHLLFRRRPEVDLSVDPFRALRLSAQVREERPQSVYFWTDNEELAAHYREKTGFPFGALPIPHTPSVRTALPAQDRLRILYLGDARLEKGFQHLPGLVRALTDDEGHRLRFEFYFQAHCVSPCEAPEITAARAELCRLAHRGVTLFTSPLSPPKYRELLASGHLVVLPYDRRAYAERSSGVFAEALAAGIPLVVPEGTWMARQLLQGAGGAFRDLSDAPLLILKIAQDWRRHHQRALDCAAAWRSQQNPQRLLTLLQNPPDAACSENRVARKPKTQFGQLRGASA